MAMVYLRPYRSGEDAFYLGSAKFVNLNNVESIQIDPNTGKAGQEWECPKEQVYGNLVPTRAHRGYGVLFGGLIHYYSKTYMWSR